MVPLTLAISFRVFRKNIFSVVPALIIKQKIIISTEMICSFENWHRIIKFSLWFIYTIQFLETK